MEVLRLRTAVTRVAAGKLQNAIASLSPDGRLRDMHVYHAAHTGRYGGRRVQVQNLPGAVAGLDIPKLLEAGVTYDNIVAAAGDFASPDDVISSLVRLCFVAAPGKVLLVCDYASIEARIVAWLAGETELLESFAAGRDTYCEMASRIYGRPITKADKAERKVGKDTVLGCGYQMSDSKFAIRAAMQGVDLAASGTSALECVEAFRSAFPKIAGHPVGEYNGRTCRRGGLWHNLGDCVLRCARGDTHIGEVNRINFARRGPHMEIILPSGRALVYRNVRVEDRVPGYATLLGINAKPKPTVVYIDRHGEKVLYGGKVTENVSQGIGADLLNTTLRRCELVAEIPVVVHVHDEIVSEVPEELCESKLRQLHSIMVAGAEWSKGLPIAAEGHACPRYSKTPWPGFPTIK